MIRSATEAASVAPDEAAPPLFAGVESDELELDEELELEDELELDEELELEDEPELDDELELDEPEPPAEVIF